MSKKKKESPRYPDNLVFRYLGFDWTIKFLDLSTEDFGETDGDQKEIRIYYKGMSDQNVIDCIIHELGHVVMFELADPVFHYDTETNMKREENLIRLTSPRIFSIIRDNIELAEFILKRIKEL